MARKDIKDQRRQQLISATMDSIAKRGLTETSITHICRGADMSRGIVNFYFDSKEKLMLAVLAHILEEYQSVWQQALVKADKEKQLEAVVSAQFDKLICNAKRLTVLSAFWGHAASHKDYLELVEKADASILSALRDSMKDKTNVQQKSEQLYAMIRGLWLGYLMAPKTTDREALAAICLATLEQKTQAPRMSSPATRMSQPARPRPQKKPAKNQPQQIDIEDLFANG